MYIKVKHIVIKPMVLLLFLFIGYASMAQAPNAQPCSSPKAAEFDFWIGEWDLTWSDSLHGTNRIEKMFNNCTIHENFSDPKTNYLGQSWSVFNTNYNLWQQTWVDNQGGYIALTGGMVADSMILYTAERKVPATISPTGKIKNRMVFFNIKSESFDWSWEASTDSGNTWKPNWIIHYARKR